MLTGAMPQWIRVGHKLSFWLACLVSAGVPSIVFWFLWAKKATVGMAALWVVVLAMGMLVIVAELRFRRQLITQFSYDGRMFQFRTLGLAEMKCISAGGVPKIQDWRGRLGRKGYRLIFRHGEGAYLQFAVPNSRELVAQLIRVNEATAKLLV
jgi:hypothetical protein